MYTGVSEIDKEVAYQQLNQQQRDFLDNHIKRSRRTMWLNVLAKHKGAHLTPRQLENDYEEISKRYLDWQLVEMIDHGERTNKAKCKCGASLRYEYIMINNKTAEMTSFGQTCLHNHIDLPQKIVRNVVKGIKEINLERDEILEKVVKGWSLDFDIKNIDVPESIQRQLEVGLPLLESQKDKLFVKHLEKLRKDFNEEKRKTQEKNKSKFGSDTFANRNVQKVRIGGGTSTEELFPLADRLHQDLMMEIIFSMINGKSDAGKVRRLLGGLLYVKIHPNEFEEGILTEAKDAARAALGVTNDKTVRKWLVEIEYL